MAMTIFRSWSNNHEFEKGKSQPVASFHFPDPAPSCCVIAALFFFVAVTLAIVGRPSAADDYTDRVSSLTPSDIADRIEVLCSSYPTAGKCKGITKEQGTSIAAHCHTEVHNESEHCSSKLWGTEARAACLTGALTNCLGEALQLPRWMYRAD